MEIGFKERAIAKAIAFAKDAQTENYLRENLLATADKMAAGTITMDEYDAETEKIMSTLSDPAKCRSKEEAETVYWDILYDMEHDNSEWAELISSFGPGTPEALIAQDMIELDESVKVSETTFNKLSNDLDLIEEDTRNLENAIAVVDNGQVYDKFTGDISADQKLVDERAAALVEAAKLKHPLSYVIGAMKDSISDVKETRDSVKALGGDYRTAVENVAKAIISKPAAIYTSAKSGTLQVLSSIAERTASIYKAGCTKFENLMSTMKEKFSELKAKVSFGLDVVANVVSFGYSAEQNIRSIEAASEPGKSYTDAVKAMLPENPGAMGQGLLAKLNDFNGDLKPKSLSEKAGMMDAEMLVNMQIQAQHKTAVLEKQGKGLDYWQSVKAASFGNIKSLAEIDRDFAKFVTKSSYEVDKVLTDDFNKMKADLKEVGGAFKEGFAEAKEALSGPIATMAAAKDKVIEFVKEIPSNIKEFFGNLAVEAKIAANTVKSMCQDGIATMLTAASKVADKAEKSANSQIITLQNFDKQMSERINEIQNQIQELRSPVTVERATYQTSPQVLENIAVLKAATPTAAVTRLLNTTLAQEAKAQDKFDTKEAVKATVKEIEGTIGNYAVSMALEDELNFATLQKAATNDELKSATKRAEVAGKIKDAFAKGAGKMMGKADKNWEKVEQITIDQIEKANAKAKDDKDPNGVGGIDDGDNTDSASGHSRDDD